MEREPPTFFDDKPRLTSRRNSYSASSRRSAELVRKIENYPPRSTQSTPKKINKQVDLAITGRKIKKNDRTNSSPGLYARRMSVDPSLGNSSPRFDLRKFNSKSFVENENDMRLDLTQLAKDEPRRLPETPKCTSSRVGTGKSRASYIQDNRRVPHNTFRSDYSFQTTRFDDTKGSTVSTSRDSVYKTPPCGSPYRRTASTEVDRSSVSPEYSGLSSVELSPKSSQRISETVSTPYSATSQQTDSSCYVSWMESNMSDRTIRDGGDGEWNTFWENYNNSLSKVPILDYYDQCPTPYRDEEIHLSDTDYSSAKALLRSPVVTDNLQSLIQKDGIQLTAKETRDMLNCTHVLSKVLTNAIERNVQIKLKHVGNTNQPTEIQDGGADLNKKEKLPHTSHTADQLKENEEKKKSLILELNEKNLPQEKELTGDKNTVTTQTDISLPNTKSAPKIFEKILRQLSRSSIEDTVLNEGAGKNNIEDK